MSRVRSAVLSGVLTLSLLGLAACGSDSSDSEEGGGSLSSVTVEGDQGKAPKVTFDGRLDGTKTEEKVLIEGDGEQVAEGDTVQAQWWIGNGFTEQETQSTWGEDGKGEPQSLEVGDEVLPFLAEATVGNKVGDRVVLMTPSDKAFGEGGGARFNLGNRDAALIVVDIMGRKDTVPPLDGPKGEEKKPAGWAPSLIEKDGVITGLDFAEAHKPTRQADRDHADQGRRRRRQGRPDPHGQLPRPGLQRRQALRRVLLQGARRVPDRHRQRHQGLGRPPRRAHDRLARDPGDPARRRLRRDGQRVRRHQGHRHVVLRRRHPRRQLSHTEQSHRANGARMAQPRAERLMNLHILLLGAKRFIGKDAIREAVYPEHAHGPAGDEAFERAFERDKDALRQIGAVIEVGSADAFFDDEIGYRIPTEQTSLPEIRFESDEAAVLGLAAKVWQQATLAKATARALAKLKGQGVEIDPARLEVVAPAITADEPAFEPLWDAVGKRRQVSFPYQRASQTEPTTRRVQPWGLARSSGRWYVVGFDVDRGAERVFRLSRITGPVRATGKSGAYDVPPGTDVRAVARRLSPSFPSVRAELRVRQGTGVALRRRADSVTPHAEAGWDAVVVEGPVHEISDEVLTYGSGVVVEGPESLRDEVVARLRAVAGPPPTDQGSAR